jgi:hypothetical protein
MAVSFYPPTPDWSAFVKKNASLFTLELDGWNRAISSRSLPGPLLLPHTHAHGVVVAFNKLNGGWWKRARWTYRFWSRESNINLSNCGWRFHPASLSLCASLSLHCFLSISGASRCNFRQTTKIPSHRFRRRRCSRKNDPIITLKQAADGWERGSCRKEKKETKKKYKTKFNLKKTFPITARTGCVCQLNKLNSSSETWLNLIL